MRLPDIRFVDSHCHLDLLQQLHPGYEEWLRQAGCLPVSWAFGLGIETTADLERYLAFQRRTLQAIAAAGLPCYFLAGIHPRTIPQNLRPERIRHLLEASLDDELCRGVGEIGLETGSEREREVFASQLELAGELAERGKVFGVHTPRRNKAHLTGITLEMLSKSPVAHDQVVVDHCTEATISEVLEHGCWAGVTLAQHKTSRTSLTRILRDNPGGLSRIMLNTDAGAELSEDLHAYVVSSEGRTQTSLTRDNARAFFGIESNSFQQGTPRP